MMRAMTPATDPSSAPEPPRTWHKSADRPLRRLSSAIGVWVVARVLGVPVPWALARQSRPERLLALEAQRLNELAQAGEHVPRVLAFDGRHLSTSDVGPTLDVVLEPLDAQPRQVFMEAASADLARFHARGHWHGGAQARNITWHKGAFHRIDFEEPLHPALPLATVQAYDALQFSLSLLRWLPTPGDEALSAVLLAYAQAAPVQGQALVAFVRRLLPRLRLLTRITGWWGPWRHSRERQRLVMVLGGLQAFAERAGSVSPASSSGRC